MNYTKIFKPFITFFYFNDVMDMKATNEDNYECTSTKL